MFPQLFSLPPPCYQSLRLSTPGDAAEDGGVVRRHYPDTSSLAQLDCVASEAADQQTCLHQYKKTLLQIITLVHKNLVTLFLTHLSNMNILSEVICKLVLLLCACDANERPAAADAWPVCWLHKQASLYISSLCGYGWGHKGSDYKNWEICLLLRWQELEQSLVSPENVLLTNHTRAVKNQANIF